MMAIGIILCVLVFFILCGICSLDKTLGIIAKNQIEIIRLLKDIK